MASSWDMNAVSSAFATAAVDSTRWVEAMDVVAAQTDSRGAALLPLSVQGAIPHIPFSEAIRCIAEPYLFDGWINHDIRRRGIPYLMTHGAFGEFQYTSREEINRHPFFQDYLEKHGFRWCAVVLMAAGDDAWAVAIQRRKEQDPFSPEELSRLRQLSSQLSSAAATARALGYSRGEVAIEAFEASGSAVFLLDRYGRVIRANRFGEASIGPDLEIVEKRLRPRDPTAARELDEALKDVLWNAQSSSALGKPIALPRSGRRPLIAYVSRSSKVSADVFCPCQAIVTLLDPELRPQLPSDLLRSVFKLTGAEARLAAALVSGDSLYEAAENFSITRATARNQLASVMSKLGVNRQGEMIAMLTAIAHKTWRLPD